MTLSTSPTSTKVWQGGKAWTMSQLKVGQQAKVTYTTEGGKKVAKSIEIETAAVGSSAAQ